MVLNYNGGSDVIRCVEHLYGLDWPSEQLDVVVIDNASSDGSADELARRFPGLDLRRCSRNTGFPANNLALRDLDGVRYVGLVNDDAFVQPGWLAPLVAELDRDPSLGAVSPLILFDQQYVDVTIDVPAARPGRGDPRALGVRVCGMRVEGRDVWRWAQVPEGGHGREKGRRGSFEWTGDRAVVRVPVPRGAPVPERVELLLAAIVDKAATIGGGARTSVVEVGPQPRWVSVALGGEPYDVVNNAGSIVHRDGYGADRGFGDAEVGRYDRPAELFAWCGGGVLLRPAYLADVGLFDERFFLYYEDTDLSWRASRAGWRLVAVPRSRVAHAFGAAGGSRAPGFFHLDRRNWWLTAERNGTPEQRRVVRSEVRREVRTAVRANVAGRLRRRRPPSLLLVGAWARIIADHRIELARRDHPSRGFPGVRATRSVLGRFQPRPRPGIPAARPWGPVPVRIDVTALVERSGSTTLQAAGWTATRRDDARRVVRVLLQEHPELDVITLVEDRSGASVVAGPREVAELLGIRPVGPTPADAPIPAPDDPAVVLWLDQEAPAVPRSGPGPMTIVAGPDAEPAAVAAALVAAHHPSGERRTTASGA